ncbi:MAG: hypothetical protein D6813_08560 [Calditrichaeota bacterium]|nr:MAG: hypothetical protein D6813_08560 [Calditrichota bacterium]
MGGHGLAIFIGLPLFCLQVHENHHMFALSILSF